MKKTMFKITQMDCPSEEGLIRTKLAGYKGIKSMQFDIANRKLTLYHTGDIEPIKQAISSLKLGEELIISEDVEEELTFEEEADQRRLLWTVLAINFIFFAVEIVAGIYSNSMGLIADSLDMLADAFVYGISLLAVGGAFSFKKKVARLAGYFQIILAVTGFVNVVIRFVDSSVVPDFSTMIIVSVFALIANGISLYLMQKSKGKEEAHMKASLIFTSNDIIINTGVIIAGVLVKLTHSNIPDLLIGTLVFILVTQGAIRILKLGR